MNKKKICSKCQKENEPSSKFCTGCGSVFEKNDQTYNLKKCSKCKKENPNNSKYCIYCGTELKEEQGENEVALGVMSLIFFFIGLPFVGIILMIIGRIKYPTNKLLKVSMWIMIILITIGIILLTWLLIYWRQSLYG